MTGATYAVSRFSVSSDVVAGHWARISRRPWGHEALPAAPGMRRVACGDVRAHGRVMAGVVGRCRSQLPDDGRVSRAGREVLRPAGVADDDALLVAGDDLGDGSRPAAAPAVGDADRGAARVLRERGDTGPSSTAPQPSPSLQGLQSARSSLVGASGPAGSSRSSAAAITSRAQALTLTCRSSRSRARRSRSSGSIRI